MPIPNPKKNEKKTDYISRCMEFFDKESKFDLTNKSDRKQALTICYSKFKEHLPECKQENL